MLGPAEDDMHGLAFAFPIQKDNEDVNDRTFALLTAHPPDRSVGNDQSFPIIAVRGYAQVADFEGNDIEEMMRQVPSQRQPVVSGGHVVSINQIFREMHPL